MNNLVSIDHINLTVKNFSDTAKWYKDVFDFEIVEQGLNKGFPWGVLRSQNTMLCIYEEQDKKSASDNESILNQFYRMNHFDLRIKKKNRMGK